jgi:hypothetical protein
MRDRRAPIAGSRTARLPSRVAAFVLPILAFVFGIAACAGADGDPAPTPSEAGATVDPTACVDAGDG